MPPKKTAKRKAAPKYKMIGGKKHIWIANPGMAGGGFWSAIKDAVGSVAKFVKDNKLISKGLALIPHAGAQGASKVAGAIGLGRKRGPRAARPYIPEPGTGFHSGSSILTQTGGRGGRRRY